MKYTYLIWLVLSAIAFAGGEFLSKKFSIEPKTTTALYVVLCYVTCSLLWLPAIYQKQSLVVAGTIWSVLSIATTVAIGVGMFGEELSTAGAIGIALAGASVILLSL